MTDRPQKTLDEIVEAARTIPPAERIRFILDACQTDESLCARAIERLESRQQWFDDSAGSAEPRPGESEVTLTGERIGAYRVVSSLGRGGMGEVFLAERADDQFRQRVAIKVVRRELLSRHVQGRLRLERQILASLEHPNIARLLDGGTAKDGTPYIVMEYVDGEPIDTYCNGRHLTIEERLKLFVVVCSAVHKAHQNLIVHRDLKPSNILVTANGEPKLLDFGIAKLLDDRQMMHTMAVTQADYRLMTPDHASPEQVRGETVTTASDIYVLGVLLYELLSGYRPFVLEGTRLAELESKICETEPIAPSEAVSAARYDGGAHIEEVAAERGVAPAKLARELKGDLDNIVLMAMRKEPERRYSSVEQFAADIRRHLERQPVLARPDAWTYRTGKFIRRNAVVVSLCAVLFAVLLGFTATTYLQGQQVLHERDLARAQGQRAEAVSSFLIEAFNVSDPVRTRGKEVMAREILDNGAEKLSTGLESEPALKVQLQDIIANIYLQLGLASEAQAQFEGGLAIARELSGADSAQVAKLLFGLSRAHEAKGELEQAEKLALTSLAIARKLGDAEGRLPTAAALCQLGFVQLRNRDRVAAKQSFQECLDIRVAVLGRTNELVTAPLDNLARIAGAEGDYALAERLYREALEIDDKTRPREHPDRIRHLHNLATALYGNGDLKAAEPRYREALTLFRQVLKDEHRETIDAMSNLGRLLTDKGEFDEAGKLLNEALVADREANPEPGRIGSDLSRLGRLAFAMRLYDDAEKRYGEALAAYGADPQRYKDSIAGANGMLGRVFLERKDPQAAVPLLEEASAGLNPESCKQNPPLCASVRASLGRAWSMLGESEKAIAALTESYPTLAKAKRAADREMAEQVHGWIEEHYRRHGRPEDAQRFFESLASE